MIENGIKCIQRFYSLYIVLTLLRHGVYICRHALRYLLQREQPPRRSHTSKPGAGFLTRHLSKMGRHDFRPLRVHQTATQLLNTERISRTPPWYNVVGSITPAQTLVRTQPLPHQHRKRRPRTKKSSKLFQPQTIYYEEDALRKEFFKDHPWELARPRLVIEDDGKDYQKTDWSCIEQPQKALSGER